MGGGFHTPNGGKTPIRQVEVEGVHHREATAGCQGGWREGPCSGNLRLTDADPQHIQPIVPSQDAGTPTNAAAHVQHRAARRELIQTAPVHQLMHEIHLGLAEIAGFRGGAVMAKMHVVSPEPLQQGVVGPAVVGLGHALGAPEASGGLEPEGHSCEEERQKQQRQSHPQGGMGRKHSVHPLASFRSWEEKVSLRTVRAASWRRV